MNISETLLILKLTERLSDERIEEVNNQNGQGGYFTWKLSNDNTGGNTDIVIDWEPSQITETAVPLFDISKPPPLMAAFHLLRYLNVSIMENGEIPPYFRVGPCIYRRVNNDKQMAYVCYETIRQTPVEQVTYPCVVMTELSLNQASSRFPTVMTVQEFNDILDEQLVALTTARIEFNK